MMSPVVGNLESCAAPTSRCACCVEGLLDMFVREVIGTRRKE